jgi:hypothetical protein
MTDHNDKQDTAPKPPAKLYLQWLGADRDELTPEELSEPCSLSEMTWCQHKIHDTDVEYALAEPSPTLGDPVTPSDWDRIDATTGLPQAVPFNTEPAPKCQMCGAEMVLTKRRYSETSAMKTVDVFVCGCRAKRSAPLAESTEREEFEKWWSGEDSTEALRTGDAEKFAWMTWQARAALGQRASTPKG